MEADTEPRPVADLASALDNRDGAEHPRSGRYGRTSADGHVAHDLRFHAVFHLRRFARDGVLELQPDYGVGRNHQLLDRRVLPLGLLHRLDAARRFVGSRLGLFSGSRVGSRVARHRRFWRRADDRRGLRSRSSRFLGRLA